MNKPSYRHFPLLLLLCTPWAAHAGDAGTGPLCPVEPDLQAAALPPVKDPNALYLSADRADSVGDGVSRLSGHVEARHGAMLVESEQAEYDRNAGWLSLTGEVRYRSGQTTMLGDAARVQLQDKRGELSNARFFFGDFHAYGEARHISIDPKGADKLEGVSYTTCPPRDPDWQLRAKRLLLDQDENLGEAYGVTLRFMHVPFLYLPYLNFPLAGRKSGLLAPSIGSTDGKLDLSIPIYWNIAPNQDATFTPRHIAQRGNAIAGEYRFLGYHGAGQVDADYMSEDQVYGAQRYAIDGHYDGHYGSGFYTTLRYGEVSDANYFNDLGGGQGSATQSLASQTHLERRFEVGYAARHFNLSAGAQSWQTLSGTVPYSRLPQLRLSADSPYRSGYPQVALSAEWVSFDSNAAVVTGNRLDATPSLRWPWRGAAWYIDPQIDWRYTAYTLHDPASGDSHPSRSLPQLSLDSGLSFERSFTFDGTPWRQTLEPRLYYLQVPYRDQSALPLFDTGQYAFTYDQLFAADRFSGADRVGDTRQVSLGLSTRLLDDASGAERLRAAIGRSYYLEDRKVSLGGSSIDTSTASDVVGQLDLLPNSRVSATASVNWDPQASRSNAAGLRLAYAEDSAHQFSLGYSERRDTGLRQAELNLLWPTPLAQWQFLGRWHYDLASADTLETIAGLEYQSCCWALQLVSRARRPTAGTGLDHSLYLSLELKGLTTLGRGLGDELEQGLMVSN